MDINYVLLIQNLKRLAWENHPRGMVGIMETVIERDLKHYGDTILNHPWKTFLNYRQWASTYQPNDGYLLHIYKFTLEDLFGIPDYNWNLSHSGMRSQGGYLECKLRSCSEEVLDWIVALLEEIRARVSMSTAIQLVKIMREGRLSVLAVRIVRWLPPSSEESLWSFRERFYYQGLLDSIGEDPRFKNLEIPSEEGINLIRPGQLVNDVHFPPLLNLQKTVAYCRAHEYTGITHHLDARSAIPAEAIVRQWKRDYLWSRYRILIKWMALYQRGRLTWNHNPEEGEFGFSRAVENFFALPNEVYRIVIRYC